MTTSTQLCRENGWGKGTVLEGRCSTPDYQYGICLEVTLVSETGILAQIISRRNREGYWLPVRDFARVWDLTRGTWKAVVWDQTLAIWKAVAAEPVAAARALLEKFHEDHRESPTAGEGGLSHYVNAAPALLGELAAEVERLQGELEEEKARRIDAQLLLNQARERYWRPKSSPKGNPSIEPDSAEEGGTG